MKLFNKRVKKDELKILENALDSICNERVKCEEDYDEKYSTIRDEISALILRRINTFPQNVPCTLEKLSKHVDVSIEQVKHHMIRTVPVNRMHDRSIYCLVHTINEIIQNKIYTDSAGMYFVMQPNWVFAKHHGDNMYIKRMESEAME